MSIIVLDNELKLTGGFGIWCFVAYLKIIWYKDTLFKKAREKTRIEENSGNTEKTAEKVARYDNFS